MAVYRIHVAFQMVVSKSYIVELSIFVRNNDRSDDRAIVRHLTTMPLLLVRVYNLMLLNSLDWISA